MGAAVQKNFHNNTTLARWRALYFLHRRTTTCIGAAGAPSSHIECKSLSSRILSFGFLHFSILANNAFLDICFFLFTIVTFNCNLS